CLQSEPGSAAHFRAPEPALVRAEKLRLRGETPYAGPSGEKQLESSKNLREARDNASGGHLRRDAPDFKTSGGAILILTPTSNASGGGSPTRNMREGTSGGQSLDLGAKKIPSRGHFFRALGTKITSGGTSGADTATIKPSRGTCPQV